MTRNKYVRGSRIIEHVTRLQEREGGVSIGGIAARARVTESSLRLVLEGKRSLMEASAARRVLKLTDAPAAYLQDAAEAAQQLKELAALGYSLDTMTAGGDMPHKSHLSNIRSGTTRKCSASTISQIDKYYQEHKDTTGPSEQSRIRAAAWGWLPPQREKQHAA